MSLFPPARHSSDSATVTIFEAPLRRRPSEVIRTASRDNASATYKASRVAIRSTSAHAGMSRGGSGQRVAPKVASASTRFVARVSWPTPLRRLSAEDFGVEVGRRRHRFGGRECGAKRLGRREATNQVNDEGGVDNSDAQRSTRSSPSARAAATSSSPVGPPACAGPRSRTRWSQSSIEGRATCSASSSRR